MSTLFTQKQRHGGGGLPVGVDKAEALGDQLTGSGLVQQLCQALSFINDGQFAPIAEEIIGGI